MAQSSYSNAHPKCCFAKLIYWLTSIPASVLSLDKEVLSRDRQWWHTSEKIKRGTSLTIIWSYKEN